VGYKNPVTLLSILEHFKLSGPHYLGCDKEFAHKYISNFYEDLMAPLRHREVTLVEIGISTGASLCLWRNYFSKATIIGIDTENNVKPNFKVENVQYLFRDAYNHDVPLSNIDIIIDDGPHNQESHAALLDIYYDKLKDYGMMVIEDVHYDPTSLIEKIRSKFNKDPNELDLRKITGLNNSRLFWIQKC